MHKIKFNNHEMTVTEISELIKGKLFLTEKFHLINAKEMREIQ